MLPTWKMRPLFLTALTSTSPSSTVCVSGFSQ